MSSKDEILTAIRRQRPSPSLLPELDDGWTHYPDPEAQFAEVLQSVGGSCQSVADVPALAEALKMLPACASASRIVSRVAGISGNVDLAQVTDPHTLANVDFAVLPGELAVAENGAVWVTEAAMRHRAVAFLAQHLALAVLRTNLVHNMHEAYRHLSFAKPGYGVFISGPSKTADIEQSLVIGAHGPRSLTVFLVG